MVVNIWRDLYVDTIDVRNYVASYTREGQLRASEMEDQKRTMMDEEDPSLQTANWKWQEVP